MPQVPVYGGPQVRSEALQPVYQRTPDVSSGLQAVARGVQIAGGELEAKLARDAETEANRIDTEISAGWLEWDAEARRQYQGQNIDQYQVEARKWWKDTADKYGKDVSPLARQRLGPALLRKQAQALGSVAQHTNAEKDRTADQTAEAAAQTSIEFGIDTGAVDAARNEVRTITAQQGARKGWTTEQVQAEQQRRLATLHIAYTTRLAQSDPEAASTYFEKNKTEIPATAQVRIEEVLRGERDNQFANQKAAEWATLPLDQQLAEAAKITDPQRREKTIQNIKVNQGLKKAAQQEREAQASDQAWQMVGQGRRVPEAVLGAMDGHGRVQLQEFLRQRAEHAATQGRKPVATDPQVHAQLWDMMVHDPEAFKNERLSAYGMKLSQSDFEQLASRQQAMRNPKHEKDTVTWNNKVTARLEMLKIATGGGSDQAKRGTFRAAAQHEFEKFQAETGKAPNGKQEDEILDRIMLPGKSGWFSGNAATYAESVTTGKPFVPDISSTDRDALVKAFQARGVKAPTDDQITQAYKRLKGL